MLGDSVIYCLRDVTPSSERLTCGQSLGVGCVARSVERERDRERVREKEHSVCRYFTVYIDVMCKRAVR